MFPILLIHSALRELEVAEYFTVNNVKFAWDINPDIL